MLSSSHTHYRKKTTRLVLSVIIPVFNEVTTIAQVLTAVHTHTIKSHEILVVDDGSTDGTKQFLDSYNKVPFKLLSHTHNQGKGAALQTGIAAASGKIILVQDADLEYDPAEHQKLIAPILADKADVVYGSRFVGSQPHRVMYFWHAVANNALTLLSNIFTNINLTDMETGFKVFRRSLIQKIHLTESGFGIEPEITAKVVAHNARIYEVGIAYHGRTYAEGKKIGITDALRAAWVIIKWGVLLRVKRV